jgi:hypothetical protein
MDTLTMATSEQIAIPQFKNETQVSSQFKKLDLSDKVRSTASDFMNGEHFAVTEWPGLSFALLVLMTEPDFSWQAL